MPDLDEKTTKNIVEEEISKTPKAPLMEEKAKELVQLVVFRLDEEEYAVEISEIREILRMSDITPMPNAPSFIAGVINVRGKIVVVIDLKKRFNLVRYSKEKNLHIIIAEIGDNTFGAIVDEVTEVLRVPNDALEEAPSIISEKIHADYVRGMVVLEDRLIILLDFKKVFEEKGLTELGELVKKQEETAKAKKKQEEPEEEKETEAEKKEKIEKMVEERMKKSKQPPKSTEGGDKEKLLARPNDPVGLEGGEPAPPSGRESPASEPVSDEPEQKQEQEEK